MKGTLHKTEKGWEVWYSKLRTDNQNGSYLDRLPLHPDDAAGLFIKDTDARYEGMEMGFEITKDCPFHFTSRCTMDRCDCDVYAKLIDDDLSDWDVTLTDGLEEVEWDTKPTQSPKDKAKEMYIKFDFVYVQNYTSKFEVKQCALIAVDETIRTLNEDIRDLDVRGNILLDLIEYWQEVKQEIDKL
jgi:hypothetical protein